MRYYVDYLKVNQEKQWAQNLIHFLSTKTLSTNTDFQILLYIILITLIFTTLSYMISLKIYKDKEF